MLYLNNCVDSLLDDYPSDEMFIFRLLKGTAHNIMHRVRQKIPEASFDHLDDRNHDLAFQFPQCIGIEHIDDDQSRPQSDPLPNFPQGSSSCNTGDIMENIMEYDSLKQMTEAEDPATALCHANSVSESLFMTKPLPFERCNQQNTSSDSILRCHDPSFMVQHSPQVDSVHCATLKRNLPLDKPLIWFAKDGQTKRLKTSSGSGGLLTPSELHRSDVSVQQPAITNQQFIGHRRAANSPTNPYLSFSIIDDAAMRNLKTLISSIRSSDTFDIECNIQDLPAVCKTIRRDEKRQQLRTIKYRMLLCRFAGCHDQLLKDIPRRREKPDYVSQRPGMRSADSEAKDLMTIETYPYTGKDYAEKDICQWRDDFRSERRAIGNYIQHAKFWKRAVEKFGLGILILIPSIGKSSRKNDL